MTFQPAIGANVGRIEDRPLLLGKGRFVDDIALPDVLHVAFVRSAHGHAAIRSLEVEAARALPGVVAVLTLDDLMPVLTSGRLPRGAAKEGGSADLATPYLLAKGEAAFAGEAIVMVVAESRYIAEDAVALVDVDYDILPTVADCRSGIDKGPPVRRELSTNVYGRFDVGYGDVDKAFRDAPHVFREELWQHRGGGHPLEGRGLLVEHGHAGGAITVWASTQMPHDLLQVLRDLLDMDERLLRVVVPDVGGGFGPKYCIYPEEVAVVAAARLLGRSLKWIEDRREHFISAIQERDQYWSLEIAVEADGVIRGLRGDLVYDLGAYALKEVNLPYNAVTSLSGPYIIPAFAMNVIIAYTNKVPVSSVRGAGYPEAAFAMERLMDLIARRLNLDRAELRSRNLIPADKMPYLKPLKARSGAGIAYDTGDYPACQAEVLAAAGWQDFPSRQSAARAKGRYIGIGIANAVKGTGRGPFESAIVRVAPSGRISVSTGAAAMGQGICTALAQICADQLGARPEDITVIAGDTSMVPLGLGGFASRQLVTAGSSVLLASRAVAAKAKKLAGHMLEVSEEDLELSDGAVRLVGVPQKAVTLGRLARILRGAAGGSFPADIEPGLDASVNYRTDALTYANACHVAEVEVDIETAGVKVLRYVAMQDSGKLINPQIVDGQIHGGIAHGISNAILEWMGYDENCQPITTNFAEYLLPTVMELPTFETIYRESPTPANPLGAKGVGELGTIPAAAAVISAIEDALTPFGVTISHTPILPHKLFELILAGQTLSLGPTLGDRG